MMMRARVDTGSFAASCAASCRGIPLLPHNLVAFVFLPTPVLVLPRSGKNANRLQKYENQSLFRKKRLEPA
jgi:hypothetical protein